jgi:beta-phosphoglucomutase-like phosphatase (HAD superfamily)
LTKQLHYFTDNSIFSAQQVQKAKPAPDLFLYAAHEMRVKPEDCIVIEDSSTGAKAAMAAGMQVMMFLGGTHANSDWYRNQISVHNKPMLSSCHELADALQQMIHD